MEENKKNYALWLYPETVRRMDSSLELANCQSRSEFVEKALHFYMGYLVTDDTTEYLSKVLLTSIQGMLDANDDRIRSLLFKLCVETNMMMHVVAAHFKDDIGDLRALRGYLPMKSSAHTDASVLTTQSESKTHRMTDGKVNIYFSVPQRQQ